MARKSLTTVVLSILSIFLLLSLASCSPSSPEENREGKTGSPEQGEKSLTVGDKTFRLGMHLEEVGPADEVLKSSLGFDWLIFGTETYESFYALGIKDNLVVAMTSAGLGFEVDGMRAGNIMNQREGEVSDFYTDKNDHNRVHAVYISNVSPPEGRKKQALDKNIFHGEAKFNFHLTNAFRVYHNLPAFKWSAKAAKAARLHSKDMGKNNYFEHEDLSGGSCLERMQKQGVIAWIYAENIAAGYADGFQSYCAWIDSPEHRVHMLGDFTSLGVGIDFVEESRYGYYQTQNFYSTRK